MRKIVELNTAEIRDVVGGVTAADYKVATASTTMTASSTLSVSQIQYQAPTTTVSSPLLLRK